MKSKNAALTFNFEWNSLIKDVIRGLWAIVLIALITLMGIQVVEKSIYTPTYTSTAVLVVRSRVGTSGAFSSLTASVEMANIFTEVFKQNSLKKLAAENLGYETFDGTITTSLTESTNLLNVSVKAKDPEMAFLLLQSILEVYPEVTEAVFTDSIIDIVSEPKMPTTPSNSRLMVYRNEIIFLSMLAEGGLIVLFSLFRGTVKEEKGFSDKVDSKLIGIVSHERPHLSKKERFKKKKRALLINDAYSSLQFTEDYKKLCTKFEYMYRHQQKKTFAISSVAENEGKSTVAANIALALSDRGYNVVLLDLDVRKPSIYKIFDFHDAIESDFSDVLSKKIELSNFNFYRYRKSKLTIAFNKSVHDTSNELLINNQILGEVLTELKAKADFVIIDTPPISVSADAISIAEVSDSTILIVRTDCVPVEDINDAILNLTESGANLEGCILNNVYKPFTLFGQMGADERGYYGQSNYYNYAKSGKQSSVDEKQEGESFSADSLNSLNSNE
ncbi:MAG: polysaccharide biosynthesis tyrosine autokinase [Clostridia bacterium]|nr:polysaccharide biosynthesis tyrosine autokinase [Clostridia bacterium]